jgi:GAF domain-containing protein
MMVVIGLVLLTVAINTLLAAQGVIVKPDAPSTNLVLLLTSIVLIFGVDSIMLIVFTGSQRTLQRRTQFMAQELRSSAEITQVIAGIQSTDELLARAVELIRDGLNYYHVRIFLLEEKTDLLVLRAGTTFIRGQRNTMQRRIAPNDPNPINEAARKREILRIVGADSPIRRAEFLSAMQTELLVPLLREDRVLGVMDVQSVNADSFSEQEIEVLRSIAAQLAIAIENARLFSELQITAEEREQLTNKLRDAAREIEQLNQEVTGRSWNRYLENRGETTIGFDWKQGTATAQTYINASLERGLSSPLPEIYDEGSEQILSVPILSRGQTLGVMEFRAPQEKGWNSRSLELARVISQRLALALDNLRLFEQAQIVANRELTASQVSTNLQTKTDVDSVIAIAAEAFQEALGASRTNIRLGKPEAQPQRQGQNGSH